MRSNNITSLAYGIKYAAQQHVKQAIWATPWLWQDAGKGKEGPGFVDRILDFLRSHKRGGGAGKVAPAPEVVENVSNVVKQVSKPSVVDDASAAARQLSRVPGALKYLGAGAGLGLGGLATAYGLGAFGGSNPPAEPPPGFDLDPLLGAGVGAGLGAGVGALTGRRGRKEAIRNALIGLAIGGAAGYGAGQVL